MPSNLLVIHFGQLGDVVLGIPALDALRSSFPDARITSLTGKPADQIVRLAGLSDEVVAVDRVAMRDGGRIAALRAILDLVRDVRRRRFDTVVDFHAFYETGLLALASGARVRVGPRRENRTLPFAYTSHAPYDLAVHSIDRYLAVAEAAGAAPRIRVPRIMPDRAALDDVGRRIADAGLDATRIVGLNPGAGWEIRRWPAERFVDLGRALRDEGANVVVFAGPEEPGLGADIASRIGAGAMSAEGLSLNQLAAFMSRTGLVVSNDTGPSHIASATGTPTLVLMPGNAGPSPFSVRGEHDRLIHGENIQAITLDETLSVARDMLAAGRTPGA